jgi:hypothetical protein
MTGRPSLRLVVSRSLSDLRVLRLTCKEGFVPISTFHVPSEKLNIELAQSTIASRALRRVVRQWRRPKASNTVQQKRLDDVKTISTPDSTEPSKSNAREAPVVPDPVERLNLMSFWRV